MTNNLNYSFLTVTSVIAILCGILVTISKNLIVLVLLLIGLFIIIAIYLMVLGIIFIGLFIHLNFIFILILYYMIISLLIFLIISNAVNLRRDKSILFSRVVIINLICATTITTNNLYVGPLEKGIAIHCDAPKPWVMYYQYTGSSQMEALTQLHDSIMFYLAIILFAFGWIMVSVIRNYVKNKISKKYINDSTLIELVWTVAPVLILILIAFFSFKLLYLMDQVTDPNLTVFSEGHQWYWSYQYPDIISDDDEVLESHLEYDKLTTLEMNNRPILPKHNLCGKRSDIHNLLSVVVDLGSAEYLEDRANADMSWYNIPNSELSQPTRGARQRHSFVFDKLDKSGYNIRIMFGGNRLVEGIVDGEVYKGHIVKPHNITVTPQYIEKKLDNSWYEHIGENNVLSNGYKLNVVHEDSRVLGRIKHTPNLTARPAPSLPIS